MEIRVRVKAGAKNDRIKRVGDRYEVTVRAEAAGGMANESVIALISKHFGVSSAAVRIIRGLKSPYKTVLLPL